MTRTFIAAAAFVTFATFATVGVGVAQAATVAVETHDLNLATAKGQAKLEARLDRAARKVCSDLVTGSNIRVVDSICVAKARASVERQVAARRAVSTDGG